MRLFCFNHSHTYLPFCQVGWSDDISYPDSRVWQACPSHSPFKPPYSGLGAGSKTPLWEAQCQKLKRHVIDHAVSDKCAMRLSGEELNYCPNWVWDRANGARQSAWKSVFARVCAEGNATGWLISKLWYASHFQHVAYATLPWSEAFSSLYGMVCQRVSHIAPTHKCISGLSLCLVKARIIVYYSRTAVWPQKPVHYYPPNSC